MKTTKRFLLAAILLALALTFFACSSGDDGGGPNKGGEGEVTPSSASEGGGDDYPTQSSSSSSNDTNGGASSSSGGNSSSSLVSSCGGSTQSSSSNKSSSSNISSSSIQTICGSVSYNPETHYCKEGTTITAYSYFTDDRDGRVYKYVSIGGQDWMAQDLYFDADSYYNITGSHYYNVCDNNDYCGYFTNASLLCPAGWKVPSFLDFANLSTYGLVNSLKAGLWKNYSYTSKSCQETYYENYSGFSAYSPTYVSCSESAIAIGWWSSEDRKEIWYMNATNDIKSRKLTCSNDVCFGNDDNVYRIRCMKN